VQHFLPFLRCQNKMFITTVYHYLWQRYPVVKKIQKCKLHDLNFRQRVVWYISTSYCLFATELYSHLWRTAQNSTWRTCWNSLHNWRWKKDWNVIFCVVLLCCRSRQCPWSSRADSRTTRI